MWIAWELHAGDCVQDSGVTHHALAGLGEIPNRR